ncbi:hypothetical protein BU197_08320 [Streptomyces sp. CBMA291]|nr:hypothetical protein [Streptomyces sp. CBMA291]MBD0714844.1 hypothetical protein [Streptomyces sp. CBMA370]
MASTAVGRSSPGGGSTSLVGSSTGHSLPGRIRCSPRVRPGSLGTLAADGEPVAYSMSTVPPSTGADSGRITSVSTGHLFFRARARAVLRAEEAQAERGRQKESGARGDPYPPPEGDARDLVLARDPVPRRPARRPPRIRKGR